MKTDFQLTSYDYYSSRRDMEVISTIVDALKKILEEDKLQPQPLFLKTSDNQSADISALNTKMSADGQTRIVQSAANPALKDGIAADENKTADISALNAEFAAVSPVTMQKLQQIYGLDTAIAADSSHIILEQDGELLLDLLQLIF